MLCAFYHGKGWRSKLNEDGVGGALLVARGLFELSAWVEAHRKKP